MRAPFTSLARRRVIAARWRIDQRTAVRVATRFDLDCRQIHPRDDQLAALDDLTDSSAADPIGYATGFVLCTGLLHVTGIALGALRGLRHGGTALRAGGGLIAACGMIFLFRAPF